MSQACDLANKKIANVILCRRYHLNAYKQAWQTDLRTKNPSANLDKEFQTHFTNMQKGYLWSLCALNSSEFEETKSEHQIIDFSEIFSLPRVFLDDWIAKHEKTRLSLLPPYREHLSQAFARFFMRVGLPTPLAPLK
ncbi:MAG: hypothetical protein P4L53_14140 [Candidatus Obscuribacterales bacterium]|nr:hypothetical protein [Candidatus Obscuribacterales bacterium]